jgi:hypothetical protein
LIYGFAFQATDQGFAPTLVKSQLLVHWLNWVITTGQGDSTALNYATLPSSLVTIDQTALGAMTFKGAPIPSCA